MKEENEGQNATAAADRHELTSPALDAVIVAEPRDLNAELNDLIKQRRTWQRKSTAGLYKILMQCFDLMQSIKHDKVAIEQLRNLLKSDNIRVRSDTSAAVMIVRRVFSADDKRLFDYAKVLEIAEANELEIQAVPDFIQSAGGIDRLRRGTLQKQPARSSDDVETPVRTDDAPEEYSQNVIFDEHLFSPNVKRGVILFEREAGGQARVIWKSSHEYLVKNLSQNTKYRD